MTDMTGAARRGVLIIAAVLCAAFPCGARAAPGAPDGDIVADNGGCAKFKNFATDISVDLIEVPPVIDNNDSWANLARNADQIRRDWVANNKLTDLWLVNDLDNAGLAFGALDSVYDIQITDAAVDSYGAYVCTLFKKISVQLLYRTMVKIPSTIAPGGCAYNVVSAHEDMLLDANRKALEDYVERLRKNLPGIAQQMESGFIAKDAAASRGASLQSGMQQVVEDYTNETLVAKMKEMAGIVNTPEESAARKAALEGCKKPPPAPAPASGR